MNSFSKNSELSQKFQKITKIRNKKSLRGELIYNETLKNCDFDSNEFTTVSSFSKKSKGNDSIIDLKAKNKEILKNLSIELSPKSINEKRKKNNKKSNNINIISSIENNKNIDSKRKNINFSPKLNLGKNNEKKKINSAYSSPIHYTLQPKQKENSIINSKEDNLDLSPKIETLNINENNKRKSNKLIHNIMKKLREYQNEIEENKKENEKLKKEKEKLKKKKKKGKKKEKNI